MFSVKPEETRGDVDRTSQKVECCDENGGVHIEVEPGPCGDQPPEAPHEVKTDLDEGQPHEAVKKGGEPSPGGGQSFEVVGSKRMLSTEDPDYAQPPDAKRMREMHQRAQDELRQRVIKVVDREFHNAITQKQAEIEEIDNRILRFQQCLHTLRYCIALNYYTPDKGGAAQQSEGRDQKWSALHPAVKRHLGKTPATQEPHPSQSLTPDHQTPGLSTTQKGKWSSGESSHTSQPVCTEGAQTTVPTIGSRATDSVNASESTTPQPSTSKHKCQTDVDKDLLCPRPPSPKYLPPRPPDNPAIISQGRHQRFQSKRRLIVGNTYQYLVPLPEEETGDSFRYKWQVYVRAPSSDPEASTFLQSVTFILDNSYAPHHIVTIKQPPFVLSRRGWGEFKVQLVLRFADQRNKLVRLLHPLVLSRPDDSLALTGLWRLGQENWYDLWLYMPDSETNTEGEECSPAMDDSCPASLDQELEGGVISSKVEENITVQHNTTSDGDGTQDHPSSPDVCAGQEDCDGDQSSESMAVPKPELGHPIVHSNKKQTPSSSQHERVVVGSEKNLEEESGMGKQVSSANGKVCKIQVRQSDGSLQPYLIPAHMYPLAMQIARNSANKNQGNLGVIGNNKRTEPKKRSEDSVSERTDYVLGRNKKQLNEAPNSVTLKLGTPHSAATISSNMSDAVGQVATGRGRTNHHTKVRLNQGNLRLVQVPSGAFSISHQHQLIKTGLTEGKLELVQQLVNKKVLKESSASGSLSLPQVLRPQTPTKLQSNMQIMPVKIVKDIEGGGLPHQNQVSSSNIRFLTGNGQMLTAEKLRGLGKLNVCVNTGAVDTTSPTTTSLVVQGTQRVRGANMVQLVTSHQGKMTVKKVSPLKIDKNKTFDTQGQSFVVCSTINTPVLEASSGPLKTTSGKVKGEEGEVSLGNGASPLTTIVTLQRTPTKALPFVADTSPRINSISLKLDENVPGCVREKTLARGILQPELKREESNSSLWEEYVGRVCEACSTSMSSAACVSAWLKALPLIMPSHVPSPPFPFCWATSSHHFLSWPLAKQRACEFQRAKEVRWWLEECGVKGWERWTVNRVVAWARGHAYTPIAPRPIIRTDKLKLSSHTHVPGSSLSYVGSELKMEQQQQKQVDACHSDTIEVDVLGLEEEEAQGGSRTHGSPLKQQLHFLQWEETELSGGCEWVGQLASQLRLSLAPEEVADGYLADVARATLWKAVLNLMEDLLRAAHFQAWRETDVVPPPAITLPHVLTALTSSRPEFDILTDRELGTPHEAI